MMSLSSNLKKLSEYYTNTERKPGGICQSNKTKVPAHITSFTPAFKQNPDLERRGGYNNTLDIKWRTAGLWSNSL